MGHYIQERTIVLYSWSKEKIKKKKLKKQISKKNLSATFHIFSKCHFLNFLSHWGGCVWLSHATSRPPYQPTSNYQENKKKKLKKKSKKKISKKKRKKSKSKKKRSKKM